MNIPRGRRFRRRFQRRPRYEARSQTDEAEILARLVETLDAPRSFLEFGFSPVELNCASLLHTSKGLLVDGEEQNVMEARRVMPRNITAEHRHVDLYNIHLLAGRFSRGKLGVLSIDVDGNDYWFLQALLGPLYPVVVAVEYNASLGLRPLSVPYDPRFDRLEKHPSGLYHGASLEALNRLSERHGYRLVAVSSGGNNAFFTRLDAPRIPTLKVRSAYREESSRNELLGTTAQQQWETIRHLPFVEV